MQWLWLTKVTSPYKREDKGAYNTGAYIKRVTSMGKLWYKMVLDKSHGYLRCSQYDLPWRWSKDQSSRSFQKDHQSDLDHIKDQDLPNDLDLFK